MDSPGETPAPATVERLYRVGWAFAAMVLTLQVAWMRFGWGGATVSLWFFDMAFVVVTAAAAVACASAAWRATGRTRRAWMLLGLAALSWSSGQLVWSYYELSGTETVPFPSWADAGYLAFVPFAVAGLLTFPGARHWMKDVRTVTDGIIIGSSLLYIAWLFVLAPVVHASAGSSPLEQGLAVAYPLSDVVLITIVYVTVLRVRPKDRESLVILGAGFVAFALADLAFAVTTATGTYSTGLPIDLGWMLGFTLLLVSALHPRAARIEAVDRGPLESLHEILLPYAPFLVALVVTVAARDRGDNVAMALFGWAILLLLARQVLAVIENHRLARDLFLTNENLHASEGQRTLMLHNITHDLRAPLSPIRLQLHLLSTQGAQSTERSLAIIDRNVHHMTHLVDDLGVLSRLEARHFTMDHLPVDLGALVRAACESVDGHAKERGVTLRVRAHADLVVEGDAARLTQVLYNVIGNAIKFTPSGGTVSVQAAADGDEALLCITDTGRGLTAEEMKRLFQPFSQAHGPDEAGERGTGLGLYICHEIVGQHGGTIECASDGLGRGAAFAVRLPLVRVRLPSVPIHMPVAPPGARLAHTP